MQTEITEINAIREFRDGIAAGVGLTRRWSQLLAVAVVVLVVFVGGGFASGWLKMWFLAGLLWLALKLILLPEATRLQQVLWFAWPGTDERAFFAGRSKGSDNDGIAGVANILIGVGLFGWGVMMVDATPIAGAWLAMAGIVFLLHFGTFRILAGLFRCRGIEARPIMDFPLIANSLSDFWGNRWNRGFNVPARRHLFLPLVRTRGVTWATMAVFAVSGLLHEVVISLPAGGGYGLPSIYFLIQGLGALVERHIDSPMLKRVFTCVVLLLPVALLFHPPFIHNVMLPFLETASAIGKNLPWK